MAMICLKPVIYFILFALIGSVFLADSNVKDQDEAAEHTAEETSKTDSTLILMVIGLLILTVLTIWLFKVKRFRFFHETGVCIVYGKCWLRSIHRAEGLDTDSTAFV